MSNLPAQHHRLNTHARHLQKTLTALLWTARFRWSTPSIIDGELLGGNGLVRRMIEKGLLVEHPINNVFAPVRYYTTLSKEGLAMLHRHWADIVHGLHGTIAASLASAWAPPTRPEHRIREAQFEHDLQVQIGLARSFRSKAQLDRILLAEDIERVRPAERPAKIPDIIIEGRTGDGSPVKVWGEVEYSRKNQREIDRFCAFYRDALANGNDRRFDRVVVNCHASVLQQWRRDFARTVIPKWHFRNATRDWTRLQPKDWHHFPEITAEQVDAIFLPLPSDS